MKVKVLKNKGDVMEFVLEDVTPAFVNALRRIMLTEIPTMSVSWVEIKVNDSALYDEIIAGRLGMIPLKFSRKKYDFPAKASKSAKLHHDAMFALEKTGPCTVYSGDLKASDKDVVPTDPKFPITELLEGQSLKLEAYAALGIGSQNAKNQAAIASYQYYPVVRKAKPGEKFEKCPSGLIKDDTKTPSIEDWTKADIEGGKCMVGEHVVELSDSKFIFRVESVSGLSPEDIVISAAELLEGKATEFIEALKEV